MLTLSPKCLAVTLQEVIPGQVEAAVAYYQRLGVTVTRVMTDNGYGWFLGKASMRPMPIIVVLPSRQIILSLIRVFKFSGIGPFANSGLDKPLGLTIGLQRIWPGPDMLYPELFTDIPECK